jgi:CheY-like chemotaxis protein
VNQYRPLRVLVLGQHNSFDQILAANIRCWGHEAVQSSTMAVLGGEGIEADVVLYDLDEAFRISKLMGGRDIPTSPIQLAKSSEEWESRAHLTIALSSRSVSRTMLEQIGAVAFLHKPFEMGRLQRYLRVLQKLLFEAPVDETLLHVDSRPDAERGSARVLVVDDDVDITDAIRQCLVEEAGYEVAVAYDGLEALEQCLTWHPHCIVTDVIMPWMNGYQVMRCLAARSHHMIPAFVIMSALTQLETPVNRSYLEDKVVAYVDKPFQIDHLLTTIEQVLHKVGVPLADTSSDRVAYLGNRYPAWKAGNARLQSECHK